MGGRRGLGLTLHIPAWDGPPAFWVRHGALGGSCSGVAGWGGGGGGLRRGLDVAGSHPRGWELGIKMGNQEGTSSVPSVLKLRHE